MHDHGSYDQASSFRDERLIARLCDRLGSLAWALWRVLCVGLISASALTAQEQEVDVLRRCGPRDVGGITVRFQAATPSVAEREVARAWCGVIGAPGLPVGGAAPPPVRWSDEAGVGLQSAQDLAFVWAARNFYLYYRPGQLEFEVQPASDGDGHQFVLISSYIVREADSSDVVAARTVAYADVSADTVVLTSALAVAVRDARFSLDRRHLTFVALGDATIDTSAANHADAFVDSVRWRTMSVQRPISKPRYFVTPLDVTAANATLGIRLPVDTVVGFVSRGFDSTPAFLWGGSLGVGERYFHELVHLALLARPRRLEDGVEEALAYALGGTMRLSFDQWACTALDDLLVRKRTSSVSELLSRSPSLDDAPADFHMTASLVLRFVDESSAEPRLPRLLDALPQRPSFKDLVIAAADALGVSESDLLQRLDRAFGPEGRAKRCGRAVSQAPDWEVSGNDRSPLLQPT